MKERPILFSSEMVRAILDGRKTQTRRIVKPQPEYIPHWSCAGVGGWRWPWATYCESYFTNVNSLPQEMAIKCPHGAPGDRLWVRETWRPLKRQCGTGMYSGTICDLVEYRAHEGELLKTKIINSCGQDRLGFSEYYWSTRDGGSGPWHPSIFMPRWASRLTLEITDVRVERLQDISEQDALAEGIESRPGHRTFVHGNKNAAGGRSVISISTPILDFAALWDSINGKRCSWESNPWVWKVMFKKLETPCPNA